MALKTIMVAASGGTASDGAIETACAIAQRVGAHVEGFHAKTDPIQVVMMASGGYNMQIAGDWIDRLVADGDELATKTRAAFEAAAARHGLKLGAAGAGGEAPSASWHVVPGYGPHLVAQRARFFDLVVLGRSERVVNQPHSDTIEETLVRSGRPVLLAPAKPAGTIGQQIALGWNGSVEAVHVLGASVALLERAQSVTVITIGDTDDDPAPLVEYLSFHGIAATHRAVPHVPGAAPGEQLLSEARTAGADLLVMGAYGRRPWREYLFGGATRQVLGVSLLPVLLAH